MLILNKKTVLFLVFLIISSIAYRCVDFSFKILTFNLSGSKSLTSLVEVISAIAFVSVGMVSGIIVGFFSRKFFVIMRLVAIIFVTVLLYFLYEISQLNLLILFLCVLIVSFFRTFSMASENSIFYDLCGDKNLSKKISYRGIALQLSAMLASLIIAVFVGVEQALFVAAAAMFFVCLVIFKKIDYEDKNERQHFLSLRAFIAFVKTEFINFFAFTWRVKILRFMLIMSFLKTFFVFWAMTSGALFKFGIEHEETKSLYILSMVLMDVLSITATFFTGMFKNIHIKFFMRGVALTGLGIVLLGVFQSKWLLVFALAVMYIGLAISQASSSFIYRLELPEAQRTQGLSFSVFPYYFADICSGLFFSVMITYLGADDLLVFSGVALIILFVITLPMIYRIPINSV